MPNWVYNSVIISGDEDKLHELFNKWSKPLESDDDERFSFQNIIPRPLEEEKNWYDWNCTNWGTKWDACEPDEYWDNDSLELKFNTAWDKPDPIFDAIAKICYDNGLTLSIHFEEEQGWGGERHLTAKGNFLIRDWDIPSTHAEHVALDRECVCEWGDFRFDDCPQPEEEVAV
jgi:hypothetical protein